MHVDVGAMATEDLERDAPRILRRMRRQAAESLNAMVRASAEVALGPKTIADVRLAEHYGRRIGVTRRQIDLIDQLTTGRSF